MDLRWEQRSMNRWIGLDQDRHEVAAVAHTVSAGGQVRYWFAWRRDGSPEGRVVGEFPTAEEAMAAVDAA